MSRRRAFSALLDNLKLLSGCLCKAKRRRDITFGIINNSDSLFLISHFVFVAENFSYLKLFRHDFSEHERGNFRKPNRHLGIF